MGLLEKVFGDLNEKEVKKVSKIADKVMAYDEAMQQLSDGELRAKTEEFRQKPLTTSCRRPLRFAGREPTEPWE